MEPCKITCLQYVPLTQVQQAIAPPPQMLLTPYMCNITSIFYLFLILNDSKIFLYLKEYYGIVGESRPLSGFFPTHADLFYRNASIS